MLRRLLFLTTTLFLFSYFSTAQDLGLHLADDAIEEDSIPEKEPEKNLAQWFESGDFKGHVRWMNMGTAHERNLRTDFLSVVGAGIGYHSPQFKGISFGLSGFFIHRLYSFHDGKHSTGDFHGNRYEIQNLDITDRENHIDLDRLEEAYLSYHYKSFSVRAGRFALRTPWINTQDGRMRPTLEEGFWLRLAKPNVKFTYQLGYLYAVSPRATVRWYGIGESIGLFSQGAILSHDLNHTVDTYGYSGKVKSSAIVIGNANYHSEDLNVSAWHYQVLDLVSNTYIESFKALGRGMEMGFQFNYNHSLVWEGSSNALYMLPNERSYLFGAQLKSTIGRNTIELNYNHITSGGRLLFPREWGREPMFTFLFRERSEGLSGLNAYSVRNKYSFSSGWEVGQNFGVYFLPQLTSASENKYSLPSYGQAQVTIDKNFHGFWEGLSLRFLALYKFGLVENLTENQMLNRVGLYHLTLSIDYHFNAHNGNFHR